MENSSWWCNAITEIWKKDHTYNSFLLANILPTTGTWSSFAQQLFSSYKVHQFLSHNCNQKCGLLTSVLEQRLRRHRLGTRENCLLVIRSLVPSCGEEQSLKPDADSLLPSSPGPSLSSTAPPCWTEPTRSGSNRRGPNHHTKINTVKKQSIKHIAMDNTGICHRYIRIYQRIRTVATRSFILPGIQILVYFP